MTTRIDLILNFEYTQGPSISAGVVHLFFFFFRSNIGQFVIKVYGDSNAYLEHVSIQRSLDSVLVLWSKTYGD